MLTCPLKNRFWNKNVLNLQAIHPLKCCHLTLVCRVIL